MVAFDNASTVVLGLINCSAPTQAFPLDETGIQRSVAMTAGATSTGVFYTPNGTTVTSKAHRLPRIRQWDGADKGSAVRPCQEAGCHRADRLREQYRIDHGDHQHAGADRNDQDDHPTNAISLIRVMAFGTLNDSTAAQYAIAQLSRGTGPTLIGTLTECFNTGTTRAARDP